MTSERETRSDSEGSKLADLAWCWALDVCLHPGDDVGGDLVTVGFVEEFVTSAVV
jgi:hypothetical protein